MRRSCAAAELIDLIAELLCGRAGEIGEVFTVACVNDAAAGIVDATHTIGRRPAAHGSFDIAALRSETGYQQGQITDHGTDLDQFGRMCRTDDETDVAVFVPGCDFPDDMLVERITVDFQVLKVT
jgi:hypothetical protein